MASLPHHFVKVPFKEAISFVGRRSLFIYQGIVYVPIVEIKQIAVAHFRAHIFKELKKAFKYFPDLMEDERLSSILIGLSNHNSIDFNL
jgi:DNA primase large subunit